MEIATEFQRTAASKKWREQTFCVLGQAGIGKSELFSVGEGSLFLDIEGMLTHLDVIKYPKTRPFMDWDELEAYVDKLVAMKHGGTFPAHIDTIIVDTATRLTQLAADKTVEIFNNKVKGKDWNSIEEITLGGDKGSPGWQVRSNLVDGLLGKLKQLNCAIVVIAHMEHKKIKNDLGVEIDRQTIDIGGQLGKAYLRYSRHILNIIGQMGPDSIITRTVRALPTANIEAKSHGLLIPDRWVLENPKARTSEALKEAALANYKKLRSFFAE